MITLSNYKDQTKGINFAKQPEHIQEVHRDFEDYADFYNEDSTIKQMLDNHFKAVDKLVKTPAKSQPKPKSTTKTVTKPKTSAAKTTKSPNKSTKTTVKQCTADTTKLVESYTEDIRIIKRFHAAVGKERQRRSIKHIYNDVERRVIERKIGLNSTYAAIIKQIQSKLKKVLDHLDKQGATHVKLEASEASKDFFNQVAKIAKSTGLKTSASLLKRYVAIEGAINPDTTKVERIYKSFDTALKQGKVCKEDMYFDQVKEAFAEMELFLKGKTNRLALSPQSLNGLEGIGLGKLKAVSRKGTAESKEAISFNKAILKAKRNGYRLRDTFKLGLTRKCLKEIVGDTNIFMSGAVLKKIMSKDEDHSLLWYNLINLPDLINNPAAIFKSKSTGYVVLTEILDYRNKPVMAAIHVNKKTEIIDLKSMYVKKDTGIYKQWEKEGLLLYKNDKSDLVKSILAPIAKATPQSLHHNKDTKKSKNNKLEGLKNEENTVVVRQFEVDLTPEPIQTPIVVEPEPEEKPETKKMSLFKSISSVGGLNTNKKINLPGELGRFLGYIERYEYSILLRGEKGAGKSRLTYQLMNTFAKAGFSIGCFSLEIGRDSNIVTDMRNEYISPMVQSQVEIAESAPNGIEDIREAARNFDAVFIDSWSKIPGVNSEDFDRLRKDFPETMFIVIFQSTTAGTARGGSGPEYDAGIVIQVEDGGRAICEKNRYSGDDLTYLVFEKRLDTAEQQAA